MTTDLVTPEMLRAAQLRTKLGAYACANLSGAYDLLRELFNVMAEVQAPAEGDADLPPLPPYIYGRECGKNERVYTAAQMYAYGRAAQAEGDDLRAAATQALETLGVYVETYNDYWERGMDILEPQGDAALARLRAALAAPNVQPKGKEPVDALAQLGAALDWITNGVKLHANTAYLVASFARALAEKLSRAEVKYGYSDGWMQHDWMDECRDQLLEHVAKGDPRDVAAYCAFLWHHGQSTAAPATQAPAPAPRTSCEYCDGTGDVHRADGEWLGECNQCPAAALRLADAIDPFTRKAAPDHLTSKVAADALRRLAAVPCPAVGADDAKDAARFRWLIDDKNADETNDTPMVCTSEDVHWGDKARALIDLHMAAKEATP